MYPVIYNPSKYHHQVGSKKRPLGGTFICLQCEASVYTQPWIAGVQNRNHCPYCLCSRHLDQVTAGDRLSACKAIMQPIGLTMKPGRNKYGKAKHGELMLIHRCSECGKLSINRLAADDLVERLFEIYRASSGLDASIHTQLISSGIHILEYADWSIVINQLQGVRRI